MSTITTDRIFAVGLDEALTSIPGYLADWAPDHRYLADDQRLDAGRYIAAIVAHDIKAGRLTVEAAPAAALDAWRRFRGVYDSLVGPYTKGPRGDFPLAMRRI